MTPAQAIASSVEKLILKRKRIINCDNTVIKVAQLFIFIFSSLPYMLCAVRGSEVIITVRMVTTATGT